MPDRLPCLALVLLVAVGAAAAAPGCTVLPAKPTGAPSQAFTDTADTSLGKLAAARVGAEEQPSAISMLDRGEEAFVGRIALIDLAERCIDVQTYCWYGDRC